MSHGGSTYITEINKHYKLGLWFLESWFPAHPRRGTVTGPGDTKTETQHLQMQRQLQNHHDSRHRVWREHRAGTLDLGWSKPCLTEELCSAPEKMGYPFWRRWCRWRRWQLTHVWHLSHAKNTSKHFTCTNSSNSENKPLSELLLLFPFSRRGN